MQCDICSEKEIEMEPLLEEKCFICGECDSVVYISYLSKNNEAKQNEFNNFA